MKSLNIITMLALSLFFSACATTNRGGDIVDITEMPMPAVKASVNTPGSLWPGVNSRNRFFSDFRARDVGDIITVQIIENTSAKGEATTATAGTSEHDYNAEALLGMPLDLGMTNFVGLGNKFNPSIKGSRLQKFSGTGSTERIGIISSTLAVRVTQVLANGNLYVEGRKITSINREKQFVSLSGIVRPEDVSSLNTVNSNSISDLRVELSGYGVVSGSQKPGWLASVLDGVWPF